MTAQLRGLSKSPSVQLHHDLASAVVIHVLKLADVACLVRGGGSEVDQEVDQRAEEPQEDIAAELNSDKAEFDAE